MCVCAHLFTPKFYTYVFSTISLVFLFSSSPSLFFLLHAACVRCVGRASILLFSPILFHFAVAAIVCFVLWLWLFFKTIKMEYPLWVYHRTVCRKCMYRVHGHIYRSKKTIDTHTHSQPKIDTNDTRAAAAAEVKVVRWTCRAYIIFITQFFCVF